MIKKILVALAILLPTVAFAQGKFGYVDAQAVMDLMPETKTAQDKLAAASKTYEDEHDRLTGEINKKYQDFQALAEDTPQAIKERRMQEIQEMDQRLQSFLQQAQQDLQNQQAQLMAPIQDKLIAAIKAVGANEGFTMILPNGVAIYTGTDVVDVTDAVKKQLGL